MRRFQGWYTHWTAEQFLKWLNKISFESFGMVCVDENRALPEGAIRFKEEIKIDIVMIDPCADGRHDEVNYRGAYEPRLPLGNKDAEGRWLIKRAVSKHNPSVVLVFTDCCGPHKPEVQQATRRMLPGVQWIFLHFCNHPEWATQESSRQEAIKALREQNLIG